MKEKLKTKLGSRRLCLLRRASGLSTTVFKAFVFSSCTLLTSCETLGFYTQAIRGQAEISFSQRPIAKVLADPDLDSQLATKLRLSREIVAFAEAELSLKSNGAYAGYADLKRKHVTYVVYAAPEFSLESKSWWYPIVGPQNYRGYFDEKDADKLVTSLAKDGLDTFKGGVTAYSTLGFFNDPILNTFIDYPEADLAELLFHELTHQRYYKSRDTAYNEALAEVVAREGTRRWLQARGDPAALAAYELRLQRRASIRDEILASIAELKKLYSSEISDVTMRRQKSEKLSELRRKIQKLFQGWQQTSDNFLSTPLNNARLVAFTTYEELVPQFEQQLAKHGNDIDAFLSEIENQ